MRVYRSTFRAMGGANEVVAVAADEAAATRAIEAAAREVLRIETKFSRYRDDSIVSRINRAAGDDAPVMCDEETNKLLNAADELFSSSGGLFDATSGILRRAWDFSKPVLPKQEVLAPLLARVGWNRVERSGLAIRLPEKGMEIDFGGFGKEYAADRAAGVLAEHGIGGGYVNLGGDLRAIGPDPDGNPWMIGIQNPRQTGAIVAKVGVAKGAITTSGDAEKYFDLDGRRYCHILNPKTGMPVNHWASATVQAPTALLAGALSTIAMLKEGAALEFFKTSAAPYLFIDLNGQVFSNQANKA